MNCPTDTDARLSGHGRQEGSTCGKSNLKIANARGCKGSRSNWCTRVFAVILLCSAAEIAAQGQTFQSFVTFDYSNGSYPYYGPLVQATNGEIYGTTIGGPTACGSVFQMTSAGTLTNLYDFCSQSNCSDGGNSRSGLVQASNGNFYGTTEQGGPTDKAQFI